MTWRKWHGLGLGLAGIAAMFVLLSLFEAVLEAFFPSLSHWQLHLLTAFVFTTAVVVSLYTMPGRWRILRLAILGDEEQRRALEQIQHLTDRSRHLEQLTHELEIQVKEREQADERLAAERNLLRTLIDNLPDLIYVKDTDSRFITCNLTGARHVGMASPEAVKGKRDFDLFPHEDAAVYYADEQEIIHSGQPLIGREEMNVDFTGTPHWFSTTKVPLRDSKGQITGLVGMNRDITALKQTEAALQKARDELEQRIEERTAELVKSNEILQQEVERRCQVEDALATERNLLRTLIDNLPHNIYIRDAESRFITSNKAHTCMIGAASEAELLGKTDFDFYPADLAEKFFADDMRVIQSGQPLINIEEPGMGENGEQRYLLTSKLPLHDQQGCIIGLMGIGIDITERKQIEEHRLALAVQRERTEGLRELIGNFSHDLKTPLSVINTNIYLLEKTPISEQQHARLEGMKAQVAHLDKLIQDILMIFRLDRIGEPELKPVDVNTVLIDLEAKFQALVEKKHQTFQLDLNGELPPVLANQDDLSRALGNLIENAVKYTPEEGAVTASTFGEDTCVVIKISDTGCGISEEDLPHIFDRFYRADVVRSSPNGGTGLGLAIVRKVVERHQGNITVESAVGKGTTFCVRLPKLPNPSTTASV